MILHCKPVYILENKLSVLHLYSSLFRLFVYVVVHAEFQSWLLLPTVLEMSITIFKSISHASALLI